MHRGSTATDNDEDGDASSREAVFDLTHRHGEQRTICVCVDDFGFHAGVNEAALRLAALDRVHAIGCLVGGGAWNSAWFGALRRLQRECIDIGLHLDLTESPLLPRSRRRLSSLIAGSLLRRLDAAAIRAEIRAQLEAFEQALGRGPTFVDGHQHVHQLPVVRDELLDELAHRYRQARPWLRSTRASIAARGPGLEGWRAIVKARGIEMLGSSGLDAAALRMGFAQNHRLLGVYDFSGGAERYRQLMAGWIRCALNADLLMCHPGSHCAEHDPIRAARLWESDVLCSVDFATTLRAEALTLAPMSRILGRAAPANDAASRLTIP
jgi:predicted glycoside hydrolase/deacetylase ChbG (UPF0249 family)